jgi:hypothetical protein
MGIRREMGGGPIGGGWYDDWEKKKDARQEAGSELLPPETLEETAARQAAEAIRKTLEQAQKTDSNKEAPNPRPQDNDQLDHFLHVPNESYPD